MSTIRMCCNDVLLFGLHDWRLKRIHNRVRGRKT
jgi:hypothetical protein